MTIFVDTSAFYALMVRTESGHGDVARAWKRSLDEGGSLVSSNYVVVETTALLQSRFGMRAVRDLEKLLLLVKIIWIDEAVHRRAATRHTASDRRSLSLVDCTSFVAMQANGIRTALALDDDFAAEGFELLPEP